MTQSIREAAQALLAKLHKDAEDLTIAVTSAVLDDECLALRAALSAPQPTADERVAEHMRIVHELFPAHAHLNFVAHTSTWEVRKAADAFGKAKDAVEQSARALLSPSQDDAEHAAMYRWLRDQIKDESTRVAAQALLWNHNSRTELDAAIRAAMKETK